MPHTSAAAGGRRRSRGLLSSNSNLAQHTSASTCSARRNEVIFPPWRTSFSRTDGTFSRPFHLNFYACKGGSRSRSWKPATTADLCMQSSYSVVENVGCVVRVWACIHSVEGTLPCPAKLWSTMLFCLGPNIETSRSDTVVCVTQLGIYVTRRTAQDKE